MGKKYFAISRAIHPTDFISSGSFCQLPIISEFITYFRSKYYDHMTTAQ